MKFGLESEKFVIELSDLTASVRTPRLLEEVGHCKVPGFRTEELQPEFVQNILEFNTRPAEAPAQVIADYAFHFTETRRIANRLGLDFVPLASLPLTFSPVMNESESIRHQSRVLPEGLRDATNCAGIHVHAEIESNDEAEIVNKFNLGNALTPLIAFAASPFFDGVSEARSMRGKKYYYGVYRECPLNGGPVPMMGHFSELTSYLQHSELQWLAMAHGAGLSLEAGLAQVKGKGVHWNPLRWNRRWNTIELRCLESGHLDQDCAKFLTVARAFKRLSLGGEALRCRILPELGLREAMARCFEVRSGEVWLPGTTNLHDLFFRAIHNGLSDPHVKHYLSRLLDFAGGSEVWDSFSQRFVGVLEKQLLTAQSPSEDILRKTGYVNFLDAETARGIVFDQLVLQEKQLEIFPGPSFSPEFQSLGPLTFSMHSSFTDSVRFHGPAKRTPGPATNSSAS